MRKFWKMLLICLGIEFVLLVLFGVTEGDLFVALFLLVPFAFAIYGIYICVVGSKQKAKKLAEETRREEARLKAEAEARKEAKKKEFFNQLENGRVVVFDTETTGFKAGYDEILQFSAIDGEGNTLLNTYLKPKNRRTWTKAEEVNGISPAMVRNAPMLEQLSDQIIDIMEAADVIVAYNAEFDLGFLKEGINYEPHNKIIFDVMKVFAPIYGKWNEYRMDYTWQKLTTCARYYKYKWGKDKAHDSLSDCRATLYCYKQILLSDGYRLTFAGGDNNLKDNINVAAGKDNTNLANKTQNSFNNAVRSNVPSRFYVYEWIIKDTGEIFYVGKGTGNRYKEFHEYAYDAEKIRAMCETKAIIIKDNLTADEADKLKDNEIIRISKETKNVLTNNDVPYSVPNGNDPCANTPSIKLEVAPYLYTTMIDEHYFNKQPRPFDYVDMEHLKCTAFDMTGNLWGREGELYKDAHLGGGYEKYYDDVVSILTERGCRILKTKNAKSIKSLIHIWPDNLCNYERRMEKSIEIRGYAIPEYHLLDVWHYLRGEFDQLSYNKSNG